MRKVLFIANHEGFSKFNAPYFECLRKRGCIVHNVSPGIETGVVDRQYDVQISRNPFNFLTNFNAYRQIKKICRAEHYDLVHCHTPVGGVLGRLCGKVYADTKIIYTAHGFHFYKGASILNWLLYYPIEKKLAKRTDCIVTINKEDFDLASKRFKSTIRMITGVGVNIERFKPFLSLKEKTDARKELNLSDNNFVIIYCAQFIKRKNHKFLIDIIPSLKNSILNIKILLVGSGKLENKMKKRCKKNKVDDVVQFLGYRTDVENIYRISDLLVSTSLQEGFGISLVEGMACGLPVVCSDIRGHNEILNGLNGFRIPLCDAQEFVEKILLLYQNKKLYKEISERNIVYANNFSVDSSVNQMLKIYQEFVGL